MRMITMISLLLLTGFHPDSISGADQRPRCTYIVHMDKSSMPMAFSSHAHWYSTTLTSLITSALPPPTLVYVYNNTLHGFSAVLSQDQLTSLQKLPGFLSAYKDTNATLDTTHTSDFLSLNPLTGLWPPSNYGSDVIIGVIDSGVWPESASFSDHGMATVPARWKGTCEEGESFNSSLCNKKLIGVRYFSKGILAADPDTNLSTNSGRDNEGHGTHTSSTAAGNYVQGASFYGYAPGTARGIAPRARVAAYKVVWDEGRYASDVLAAMDQAIEDGVDVISISLGFDHTPLFQDPVAIASFGAMERGVLVSTSAGNRREIGSLHNGIPWVLTVAAGTIDRTFAGTVILGNGVTVIGWTTFPVAGVLQDLPLIYNRTLSSCDSTEELSRVGRVILVCEKGSIYEQMIYVSLSKAAAAIIISDDPVVKEASYFGCTGVVVSTKDAATVINYAATEDASPFATIEFMQTFIGTKPAPVVALYTSRGPARSYPGILKPDIMAPGTLVLASWIPHVEKFRINGSDIALSTNFAAVSGTSMACPHASGVSALLRGAHPEWSPAAIRSAPDPLDNTRDVIKDPFFNYGIATPLAMGSGHLDPNQALDPGLVYDAAPEDYVNLLCSSNFTKAQILTITGSGYNCENPSPDLNYPSFVVLYTNNSNNVRVQEFRRIVTHVAEGPTAYKAQVIAPNGSDVNVSPNTLVFGKKYDKQLYYLTIKYRGSVEGEVAFGSITWVEDNGIGKHTVRSPIVVTPSIPVW